MISRATTQAERRGRLYHKAGKMREDGAVSALCFKRPQPIVWPASWTIAGQVNCPKCLKIMAESQNRAHREPKGERPGGGRGKGE